MVAADRNPSAAGFRFADRRAIISVEDEPQLDRLAAAERVDGIVAPGIDWPVAIAARIADRIGLPHPIDPATAVLATSKLRQRERFAEAGVPHPRHVVCATVEEAAAAAAGFGYPCVVKAPDRQGQKGLVLVRGESVLEEAFKRRLRVEVEYVTARGESGNTRHRARVSPQSSGPELEWTAALLLRKAAAA